MSIETLAAQVRGKVVSKETLVWREGMGEWAKAGVVVGDFNCEVGEQCIGGDALRLIAPNHPSRKRYAEERKQQAQVTARIHIVRLAGIGGDRAAAFERWRLAVQTGARNGGRGRGR